MHRVLLAIQMNPYPSDPCNDDDDEDGDEEEREDRFGTSMVNSHQVFFVLTVLIRLFTRSLSIVHR